MRLQIKSTILLLFLSVSFYAQEYSGKGEDINKILNNITNFSKACVGDDHDKLTSLYSKDGKIFAAGEDIIEGEEAIKKRWKLPKGMKLVYHKVNPKEIKIIGDYAYDYGYYKMTVATKKGKEISSKGNYIIIWKKEGSDWKIYLDIWNKMEDDKKKS
ncbi:MAG TPA: DUF4440 domain-containing protein [Flavobacteriia bacterium]|jgi:ketosteroid isomerase-like protein|nr:DUF4440 domain-containing protein [Flavobacteriia bacterium]